MADTRVQLEVEDWIRNSWLCEHYGQPFAKKSVRLTSGGMFEFDAVSEAGRIVANISTSSFLTAKGKPGIGKVTKVRSDIFFLLLADADRRLQILTEGDMHEHWCKEARIGRVPSSIEFVHVALPDDLAAKLRASRRKASDEVSPAK